MTQLSKISVLIWFSMFRNCLLRHFSIERLTWSGWGRLRNCNMAIAAKRLGLCCITIGHVGNEIYGDFLLDVLHDEELIWLG